jgi:N-methylhydantoinase A/oxoprolinase/acetone carboxylase beta subunit
MAFDFVRTDVSLLAECDLAAAAGFFANAEQQGRKLLRACGVDGADITVSRIAELRYVGQGYEVGLRLPDDMALDADGRKAIEALFASEYASLYGNADPENRPELVNWRMVVSGPAGHVDLHSDVVDTERDSRPLKGRRSVYFPNGGYREVPVFDRYALAQDALVEGPAIVEERESTAVIAPGWSGSIDAFRNLIVRRGR